MRIYITSSFEDSPEEIEHLCSIVRSAGFHDFNFIRDVEYNKKVFDSLQDLMRRVQAEIEKSDALLVDMTDKPTGRMIAAGIAYSLGKKIIIIMKRETQIKDTTKGIADVIIEYDKIQDIKSRLTSNLHL